MKEHNPTNRRANIVFAIFIIVSGFFIAADTTPSVRFVKRFIYYALFPSIESASFFMNYTGTAFENLRSIVRYRQENISLKNQNILLLNKLHNLQGIREENLRLGALLSLSVAPDTKAVFARVVLREPSQWYQWMVINKGSRHGITRGLAVVGVTPQGQTFAVGRIAETFAYSSRVALITNSRSVIPSYIEGSGFDCLAEGQGGRLIRLTFISQEAPISVGDEILTSPLSAVFRPSTPVGRIRQIFEDFVPGYKYAIADLHMHLNQVYEVAVIVPIAETEDN
ncbi:MAG: rod shape-determining protein MreC [Elusimicrobia bacterium]|nr:rod shape-determining protein MreC [Elusimicrobiota bacterium]